MSWFYLSLAILFEVCGTLLMKVSNGLSHISYTVIMFVCYVISLTMLSFALKSIEIGTAYAIWSGVGIVLIVTIGILFFKEPLSLQKMIFISLIVIGAIGLNLFGEAH
ncbi:multidrug efflux SMR transporter [Sporolactobacillus shoreae]|uniref:Multidrug efflux SMR transporter n=1 Tax=Sporolactobacillus shoreae TaxID=1465501 RepID=A0A4Z0GP26_9BACL|nr:multidrug efflux SMR transporter [Sporolactobacillus shoreae]TGA98892.1 multidrug efflux SMR transporter [Sporolactobacillus shoreae]